MTTQDLITVSLQQEKLQSDGLNRILDIPVIIPYKGFEIVVLVRPVRSDHFHNLTLPVPALLRVLDRRDSAELGSEVTNDIYSPEDFGGDYPAGSGINIQKAFNWIDRQIKVDSMLPYERFRKFSFEEKLMITGMGARVRAMLPELCRYFSANWESFQLKAGCRAADSNTSPSRVIEAMSQVEHFQKLWFASESNTSEETIRNWLFVYLLGETELWRADSGWVPRTIPLDKTKNFRQIRWTEMVVNQIEDSKSNFYNNIHYALDNLPEFKPTQKD